ncbi:hypothetical protein LDENG_00065930 [Lucifuga dentata]|nr:hypothetical protein LDENG_00065930 [Lucifuga dentata]
MKEHLVWGRLPHHASITAGSTVIVEPSESRTVPRTIMVGCIITPLWGDGYVPVRLIKPSTRSVTLRHNCKIADVSTCVALEDFDTDYLTETDNSKIDVKCTVSKTVDQTETDSVKRLTVTSPCPTHYSCSFKLQDLGLQDINVDSSHVKPFWKKKLVELLAKYEFICSRHSLDCDLAKDFAYHIWLSGSRPFRLPYRRLSPSHYEKLHLALNEMEERDIIKSTSEYASSFVLVWKKKGDLWLCTDFRWLNAHTIKDVHPLPHQADSLAALGGNPFFSTMDLTSGYYNVEGHEEDKKFTAFTSPFGLYEYNRLLQGLCNSPATFLRMMMSIFGDQNFLSLLCYLDDILVFAP